MYCDAPGLLQPRGLCDPGYLCHGGATTSNPIDGVTGELCPAGGYCLIGKFFYIHNFLRKKNEYNFYKVISQVHPSVP